MLLAAACAPAPAPESGEAWLTEITAAAGLPAAEPFADGTFFYPEIMGPGVALLDYDGDGDLDLLQLRVPPPGRRDEPAPNRLWRQDDDGRFVDVTAESGLGDPGFAQGVAVGDVDDDGDLDVYFANWGSDSFYRNRGDGTFYADESAGFRGEAWSSSATFCDYDGDGDLDLFVAHYLRLDYDGGCRTDSGVDDYCGPGSFDGVADTLWRNEGGGVFTDATAAAGLLPPEGGMKAKGLGVVCLDLTGDGVTDLYVANDAEANRLWVGRGDGTFRDQSVMRGVALNRNGRPEGSMGLAVGDVDGDGRLDLLATHLAGENNTLYRAGDVLFADRTVESGMAEADRPHTGFGCAFLDVEHDGDLDLAVANGDVRIDSDQGGEPFWHRYAERNLFFLNDGTGRFALADEKAGAFAATAEVTRGLATGDLDDDGDLDLVVGNGDNSLRVYRNDAPKEGRHLLRVRALTGKRDALGAQVTVHAGGRMFVSVALAGASYASSQDPRAHFGLGDVDTIERVEIRWPDGSVETFDVDAVDREWTLAQGEGR